MEDSSKVDMQKQMRKRAASKSRARSKSNKKRQLDLRPVRLASAEAPSRAPILGSGARAGMKDQFSLIYWDKHPFPNSAVSGVGNQMRVRMNSIHDVFESLGGNQRPAGYNQVAGLYERYKVTGFKYKVSFCNKFNGGIAICGVTASDDTHDVITQGIRPLTQSGNSQWGWLVEGVGGASGASNVVTFSGYVDLASFNGMTRQEYNADDLQGSVMNGDPADTNYLYLWCEPAGTVGEFSGIEVVCEFTYYVDCKGLRSIGNS